MQVAVLGPLQVQTDDRVALTVPGPQERLLLAALAAGAPGVVGVDSLIATVWGGEPPATPRESLRASVARLRKALEPGLPENASGRYVVRRGSGYALIVARGDIDALRMDALADRGRGRLTAGDAAEAARLLSAALGLWRGEPYADWPGAAFARDERRRLTELRAGVEAGLREARGRLDEHPDDRAGTGAARPPAPWLRYDARESVGRGQPTTAGRDAADGGRPAEQTPWGAGPVHVLETANAADTAQAPETAGAPEPTTAPEPATGDRARRTLALAGVLVASLVAAGLAVRSQRAADDAAADATAAEANRLAALSLRAAPLDVSLLLAAQAFRLADTPETREVLFAAVAEHRRVDRVARFVGVPQGAVLLRGGRTLTFGIGTRVVAWSVGPRSQPRVVMDIPEEWGAWIVAAPSPTGEQAMGAGENDGVPWLRMVSVDGTSRLLLEGDQVGGRPVDGAVSADGRRILLLVAEPDDDAPHHSSRWRLIDVASADGASTETGIGGAFPAPLDTLRADFSPDAGSVVVWGDGVEAAGATLVDVADGRRASVPAVERTAATTGYRALPSGAVQLWDDGTVTVIDRSGSRVQHLGVHQAAVRDAAVSPDGTWAASAGDRAAVFRWRVDPSTGRWSEPEALPGHAGDVGDVEADAAGRSLFTVSVDQTVIRWDMGPGGGSYAGVPGEPSAWLDAVCAIVARDLTPSEWDRYLPDHAYRATCTDRL